jgi:hypothetical protein
MELKGPSWTLMTMMTTRMPNQDSQAHLLVDNSNIHDHRDIASYLQHRHVRSIAGEKVIRIAISTSKCISKDRSSVIIPSTATVSIESIIYLSESTGISFITYQRRSHRERSDNALANDHC